ncbi:hypothetical protein [Rhizobium sp. L51/94]|uniref:hypothetical protein n=1 Tax=Rhizobium sp. L51/94 TaxID=2819999 RepID=UPI001C5BEE0E|nr:hypothetical protein [Rhizobium sp. L51/94]QXZ80751.1 hypothetical protein J5274_23555 [Rhizobium sp. L51/94]
MDETLYLVDKGGPASLETVNEVKINDPSHKETASPTPTDVAVSTPASRKGGGRLVLFAGGSVVLLAANEFGCLCVRKA